MKNALKLLWMYLTLLICGLVLITMILMLYTSVLNFVAGQEKKAVVYKMKLPEVPEGKRIASAQQRATEVWVSAR